MKVYKIIVMLLFVAVTYIGCDNANKKQDNKENKNVIAANTDTFSVNVSGMSCEMGCAKTIESKLAKKEGVLEAKVVFNDSIATIKYDTSKLDKKDLMAFIEGVGDGETYKASESAKKDCATDCKKEDCTTKSENKKDKACMAGDKKDCCKTDKA